MGYKFPLGPYHPAFEEGEYIELQLEGEMVVDAEIKMVSFTEPLRKALPKERLFAIWA